MNIEELIENFDLFEYWDDRYGYVIYLGSSLPPMEETLKTEHTKVRGCLSQVWMVLGWDESKKLILLADSDSHIVRGLIAVLCIIFHGKTAEEVKGIDIDKIFKKLGLDQHLFINRRNGFYAMVERIRTFTARDR